MVYFRVIMPHPLVHFAICYFDLNSLENPFMSYESESLA